MCIKLKRLQIGSYDSIVQNGLLLETFFDSVENVQKISNIMEKVFTLGSRDNEFEFKKLLKQLIHKVNSCTDPLTIRVVSDQESSKSQDNKPKQVHDKSIKLVHKVK